MSEKRGPNRREFFSYVAIGWVSFSTVLAILGGVVFRFLYPNVVFEPPTDFIAGLPDEYDEGVDERWKNVYGVWMYKNEGRFVALSNICTHLGCIPTWLPAESKFKCPCHGSGYYPDGINFEGPAPRPLERYRIFYNAEGKVVVDKSKVYRFEKGEWDKPGSFVNV